MASLLQRLLNRNETRAQKSVIPPRRSDRVVTPNSALTLASVYRAISILATPISKMPIDTYRYATGVEQRIPNPLFVNRPELDATRRETLYGTVVSLAMFGEAFWLKNYTTNGTVNNIQLLPAELVEIRTDNRGRKLFMYDDREYTAERIEHLKLFIEPGNLHGVSPIRKCAADIKGILDLRDFAANWFGSSGVPTGVLKSNAMLNQEQAEQVRQAWLEAQSNRTIAVVGNGFDYAATMLSPKDALLIEAQQQGDQKIARLFGIPARLMLTGVDGTSDTYSNLSDENQIFYRHTIMAYTDAIGDALSNCLPRGTKVEFNFEGLFKADVAARYNYYSTGLAGESFLTVDEVRAKEGLEPLGTRN